MTNTSRTPPQSHTTSKPPFLLLSLVIKVSAWPRWPRAARLLIEGRRGESCHIPLLHGGATSLSSVCVRTLSHCPHCLSPLYLTHSRLPISFASPTRFIFTRRPSQLRTKQGSAPDTVFMIIYIGVIFTTKVILVRFNQNWCVVPDRRRCCCTYNRLALSEHISSSSNCMFSLYEPPWHILCLLFLI